MRHARTIVVLVLLAADDVCAVPDLWGTRPASIEECRARIQRTGTLASWFCFYRLGLERREQIPGIVQHLDAIRARTPNHALATFMLASVVDLRGDDRTQALYDEAQAAFRRRGEVENEFYAAMAVVGRSAWLGDPELAAPRYTRALELAQQLGDPDALAYVYQVGADLALGTTDYGRAEVLIRQSAEKLTAGAPPWMRWRVPHTWARVYSMTGRPWRALEKFQQGVEGASGDPTLRAFSLQGCAQESVRLASAGELPMEQAERYLDEALTAARTGGVASFQYGGELPTTMLRHALRGSTPEGVRQVQTVLERGRVNGQWYLKFAAAELGARFAAETGRVEQARALTEEALRTAEADQSWISLAHLARTHVEWRAGDRAALVRAAERTMESMDRLRWSQRRELARARTSAEWAFAYELLAGWQLDLAGPEPTGAAVEPAFTTMERLRGRTLLDELTRSGVGSASAPPELATRRAEALAALTRAQTALLGKAGDDTSREDLRRQAEAAEATLAEVEDLIARSDPRSAPVPAATLAELQAALREDEALLSFQLWRPDLSLKAPYPAGASWLVVLTRDGASAVRMPDAQVIEPKLALFRGMLVRGDSAEAAAGARLRGELFGRALDRLPTKVRSLVVVPDGPLHGFPLDALALEDGSPLGVRYAVSMVPSASLWLRWRRASHPVTGPALALADPDPTAPPGRDRDASRWLERLQLPSLPHAREEATALVKALGPGGVLRLGPDANEHFLKTSDLRPWGVIHFATHAVVDETEPERSALALAAGDPEEDGLLQPREIAALDLAGKVVLLSACRTASGELLQGEGTLGLVRAFFRAGALAVVASPWPLDDLETQKLIDELSARLARGETLSDALAGAKRARHRAGAPALAWAGLQLHGDGRAALASGAAGRSTSAGALIAAAGVLVVIAALLLRTVRAARGT